MSRTTAEAKIREDIAEYGWHVVKVLPEGDHQPHSYSIGLFQTFGHPEIAVVGLRGETAHALIASVVKEIRAGKRFEAGNNYPNIIESFAVTFVAVPEPAYPGLFGYAIWYYGSTAFPVLQMVWPDRDGRFPWQPEFAEDLKAVQPIFGA